jgi:DNA-directed RNA polymerase specialized sigma24 family protein
VSQEHGKGRLRVEVWEMELARRIAGAFRTRDEDMEAELFKRLVEIKARQLSTVRNWQAFLAQALYNAAKNVIRHDDVVRHHTGFSIDDDAYAERPSGLSRRLAATEDTIDLRLQIARVWATLTPEMRELAELLHEEEGKISAVAKRLKRPRKTVEYWIEKLRNVLKKGGVE